MYFTPISKGVRSKKPAPLFSIFVTKNNVMIKFNELRMSEDRKSIAIDLEIEGLDVYSGLNISSIYIEHYKHFDEDGPGEHAYLLYSNDEEEEKRSFSTTFSLDMLSDEQSAYWPSSLKKELFYVYVECDGEFDEEQIQEKDLVTVGVVPDWRVVFETGMQLVKGIISNCGNICDPQCGWADFIFRWHALKLGIETSDYAMINELWPMLFNNVALAKASCGCGR